MRVVVRLFAGLRERAGADRRELDLDDGASVGDVWPALDLGDEPAGLLYAVNRTYADRGQALAEGDEVALIPPVSGGAFRLTYGPVNLTSVIVEVVDEQAGAIATFLGTVRAHSRGRDVIALEYEAYEEMAEEVMAGIADELRTRYELLQGRDVTPPRARRGRRDERRDRASRRLIGRTRWRPAQTRSRHSSRRCRSGRRSSTSAARSGSAAARKREEAHLKREGRPEGRPSLVFGVGSPSSDRPPA